MANNPNERRNQIFEKLKELQKLLDAETDYYKQMNIRSEMGALRSTVPPRR